VIREELTRLFTWEERHRRLAARLLIALGLTLLVLAVGSVLIWVFESGVKGGDIHGYGDAVFFTAVQLLTISSAITNPLTAGGKIVDVVLEIWAIFVVTSIAAASPLFLAPATPVRRDPGWREAGILVLLRGGCWTTGNQASRHAFGTACCRCCPVTSLTSRSRSGAAPGWLIAAGSLETLGRSAVAGFRSGGRVAQPRDLVREGLR
jgi:hypothetical protein